MACLGKGLARKSAAQHVKYWNFLDWKLRDVAGEKLFAICKYMPVFSFIEIMPISSPRSFIPLACKHTLGALCVVKCYMEASNPCEQIYKFVFGLIGHTQAKSIQPSIGSRKWPIQTRINRLKISI